MPAQQMVVNDGHGQELSLSVASWVMNLEWRLVFMASRWSVMIVNV